MSYMEILTETHERVTTITLNRPTSLNAWTPTMEREFRDAVTAADNDGDVGAIVITGAGRGFCSGVDMTVIKGLTEKGAGAQIAAKRANAATGGSLDEQFQQRFSYLFRVGKPLIAAINGPAAGIGLCLALFCDLRLISDSAKVTTSFARRGLIAEHGISWMLPRLIGTMNALDLLLSGRVVPAAEAAQMGLARIIPAEDFLASAHKFAAEFATLSSPRSMRVMKKQVYEGMFQPLSEAWSIADAEMVKSFESKDFAEGVAHFLEKRPPRFSGD